MKSIARLAAAGLVLGAAPLAGAQELIQGYTCCNLHYDKEWISDANWGHAPMIPAGARIKVLSYDSDRKAAVEVDGKPMRISHDYGYKQESLEKFISKIVVKANPKAKIDRYPQPVRAAIHSGKVIPGMTREQVIVSVGYPPVHRTPTLDSPVWHHWQSRAGRYEVRWDEKGKVLNVIGQK
jgi:hypothetical protein